MELFHKLFGSLLVFVYRCFDRIVLSGYLTSLSRTGWKPTPASRRSKTAATSSSNATSRFTKSSIAVATIGLSLEPTSLRSAQIERSRAAPTRRHHKPDSAHRPNSKLEAAYHDADKAIEKVIHILAGARCQNFSASIIMISLSF